MFVPQMLGVHGKNKYTINTAAEDKAHFTTATCAKY